MSSFRVDLTRWPIVVHTTEGDLTDADVEAYIREADAVLARQERHVTVLDSTRMGKVSAYVRKRTVQWQRDHRRELAQYCAGTVFVISSPWLRFMAMTVLMVTNLPTPVRVCDTLEEGLAWAEERLSDDAHA